MALGFSTRSQGWRFNSNFTVKIEHMIRTYITIFLFVAHVKTAIAQQPYFAFTAANMDATPRIKIDSFILLLKEEEAKFSKEEQLNHINMVTRLRKIYYGSPNYDKYLIKNSNSIKPYYHSEDIVLKNSEKMFKNRLGMTIKTSDTVSFPKDSTGQTSKLKIDLATSQEILVSDNQLVDIGHVLCGIDAFYHPHAITPPKILGMNLTRIKIDKNQDAVTWVGDLGSVVAEVYFAQKSLKRKLNDAELQAIWNEYASPADNLGNIDSYILASIFQQNLSQSVSQNFTFFYIANTKQLSQRILFFATTIGLEWNGQHFVNKKQRLSYYADQVNDAAAFYYAISAKRAGRWNLLKALPSILRISHSKYAKEVVAAFFDALEQQLRVAQD
jgi:hypothetical protein